MTCLFEQLIWLINVIIIVLSLQSTDEMLVHLQSFSSNPSYYTIPESAKNGVPLFYLPPNSNNPVSIVERYECNAVSLTWLEADIN